MTPPMLKPGDMIKLPDGMMLMPLDFSTNGVFSFSSA
jgi:hypothetical protein